MAERTSGAFTPDVRSWLTIIAARIASQLGLSTTTLSGRDHGRGTRRAALNSRPPRPHRLYRPNLRLTRDLRGRTGSPPHTSSPRPDDESFTSQTLPIRCCYA